MAKLAKKKQTNKGLRFEVVNPNAAGIDISPKEMQVCVPADRDGDCNRHSMYAPRIYILLTNGLWLAI